MVLPLVLVTVLLWCLQRPVRGTEREIGKERPRSLVVCPRFQVGQQLVRIAIRAVPVRSQFGLLQKAVVLDM